MRKAVGVTGRLWRKVSQDEKDEYLRLANQGISFRDIGKQFNRDHKVVAYNLRPEKAELLRLESRQKRLLKKIGKEPDHVLLRRKLGSCLQQVRKRAERKHIPIDIDINYLIDLYHKENGACCLTGLVMELQPLVGCRANPYAISLDRIDSTKGYTKDNVRLVIWYMNWAMGGYGEKEFEEIAKSYLWHKFRYKGSYGNQIA